MFFKPLYVRDGGAEFFLTSTVNLVKPRTSGEPEGEACNTNSKLHSNLINVEFKKVNQN
jgi:hypothetical protein